MARAYASRRRLTSPAKPRPAPASASPGKKLHQRKESHSQKGRPRLIFLQSRAEVLWLAYRTRKGL